MAKPGKPLAMSQVVERYPPLVLRQDEQEKVSTCTDMQQTCKMSSMFVGFCSNKNLQVEHLDQRMTKDMVQICPSPKQASLRRGHYGITVIIVIHICCCVLFNIIHRYWMSPECLTRRGWECHGHRRSQRIDVNHNSWSKKR